MGQALEDKKKLKRKVMRALQPWVTIYKQWPDRDLLIRSLLKGAESRLAEKRGEITYEQVLDCRYSRQYEYRAFDVGRECVENIKI